MLRTPALAAAVLALALTAGCGASRPSTDDVTTRLGKGVSTDDVKVKVTGKEATCVAKALTASKLSDDALRTVADGKPDAKAQTAVESAAKKCEVGRPTVEAMSDGFLATAKASGSTVKITRKQTDCVGKILVASDISDEALRAIVNRESGFKESKADDAALAKVRTKLAACQ